MSDNIIQVYIGYDPVEPVAYHTLIHSILTRSSLPVQIIGLNLNYLKGLTRIREENQSSAFSFSRWLVPYLNNYEGWAIYMDCDMLCLADIAELWKLRNFDHIVQVVKHIHVPKTTEKYLGNKQIGYDRKNWSSMMMFNCGECKNLTYEVVNTAPGLWLHQFEWLDNTDSWAIGSLPINWNYLVGYNSRDMLHEDPKIIHFTEGGPWLVKDVRYVNQEYAEEWHDEFNDMTYARQV